MVRRPGGKALQAQEDNKRSTRGTQQSNTLSPGLHQACASLEGGFGPRSSFYVLHSAFAPPWLCVALLPSRTLPSALCPPHSSVQSPTLLENRENSTKMGY